MKKYNFTIGIILSQLIPLSSSLAKSVSEPLKYGSFSVPLSQDNQYFNGHSAPDFWQLMPNYAGAKGDCGCTTILTMGLNAFRTRIKLSSSKSLINKEDILAHIKPNGTSWQKRISSGSGFNLDEVEGLFQQGLKVFDIHQNWKFTTVHASEMTDVSRKKALLDLRDLLSKNESDADSLLLINYSQGHALDSPSSPYGQFAWVGAFDQKEDKVLVLDVDREWFEPYWVPADKLYWAMNTRVDAGEPVKESSYRGYVYFELNSKK